VRACWQSDVRPFADHIVDTVTIQARYIGVGVHRRGWKVARRPDNRAQQYSHGSPIAAFFPRGWLAGCYEDHILNDWCHIALVCLSQPDNTPACHHAAVHVSCVRGARYLTANMLLMTVKATTFGFHLGEEVSNDLNAREKRYNCRATIVRIRLAFKAPIEGPILLTHMLKLGHITHNTRDLMYTAEDDKCFRQEVVAIYSTHTVSSDLLHRRYSTRSLRSGPSEPTQT